MIKKCDCWHKFQNERYGANMRVHNYANKANDGRGGWRCTVCTRIKEANAAEIIEHKE